MVGVPEKWERRRKGQFGSSNVYAAMIRVIRVMLLLLLLLLHSARQTIFAQFLLLLLVDDDDFGAAATAGLRFFSQQKCVSSNHVRISEGKR